MTMTPEMTATTTKRTGKVWKDEPVVRPNYTSIGADLLTLAFKKQETKSGQIYMVANHTTEIGELAVKLKALGADEKVRTACTDYIGATPEGAALMKRQAELVALGKAKNKLQRQEYNSNVAALSASSITLQRSADCWFGLQRLISAKVEHNFSRIANASGANVWVLNIWRNNAEEKQWMELNAKQLAAAASATFTPETTVTNIIVAINENNGESGKAKTPNEEKGKGNGELIATSKLSGVLVDVDNTLARYTDESGKGFRGLGPNAIAQALSVWARLDALLTEKDKEKARKAYTAEAEKAAKASAKTSARAKQQLLEVMRSNKAKRADRKAVNKMKSRKAHRRVA